MKKYISFFVAAIALCMGFSSCNTQTDEPAGGTAVEKMAGHWVVTVDAIVDGETYEDPYGMGEWELYTYNTAADDADQMWISDSNNFWGFTFKTPVNIKALTFDATEEYIYTDKSGEDVYAIVHDGKITENGGLNVNGKPTDRLDINIEFTDDPGTIYHIYGVRYAGF